MPIILRPFSTALRRARQALYEPYVAPLNQEQKKALRKVMSKSNPKYHGSLHRDLGYLLEAYETPQSIIDDRMRTINHVEEIIKSAFGSNYSIINRSLSTYARDIDVAPLELAVHDNSHERGFPPEIEGEPLAEPYKHEVLAKLLQQHGYTGYFVHGDAERTLPPLELNAKRLAQPIEERGPLPMNYPWPSFTPRPTPHLTYPPVLYAEHTSLKTLPFFLSPPMPTHLPLIRLLRTYSGMNQNYADLIALVLLWVRSIDLPQITPTCVALMVIGFLQNRRSLPSLQNPADPALVQELAKADEGVWVRAEWQPRYSFKAFWLETTFVTSPHPNGSGSRKLGPLLVDFFHFWSQMNVGSGFLSSSQSLSVREGAALPRRPVIKQTGTNLRRDEQNDLLIDHGEVPWEPTGQPVMWQTQPIVAEDPFMPSYNHARSMSKAACGYFHHFNSLSYRTLSHGHPGTAVLGPHLPMPRGKIHAKLRYNRPYSTRSLAHDAKLMYEATLPPPPVLAARVNTISRVQKVITNKFGPGYSVECFGSARYGVSSATSDLDLVVMDHNRKDGFAPNIGPADLPDIYDIKLVARVLRKKGFTEVFAIPKATVPIVKFRDPTTGLECDLNINDRLGLWNTLLIKQYCDLAPDLVRPMAMIIKRWAKSHGLNDPSGQNGAVTFSSYALVLMVIGYLQVRGRLPNLQAGLDPLPEEHKRGQGGVFWARTKKGDSVRCDTRFSIEKGWRSEVELDLEDALTGWFRFWADEHDYDKDFICIRKGGLLKRERKQPQEKKAKKKKLNEGSTLSLLESMQKFHEQLEDAALAAYASQSDAGASADAEGDVKVIGIAAESEAGDDLETQQQNTEESEGEYHDKLLQAKDVFPERHKHNVPPATTFPSEEIQVELEGTSELQDVEQTSLWCENALVVADPFLSSKNVCGQIPPTIVNRFKTECHRSVQLLSWGVKLEEMMGNGQPVPSPARGRSAKRRKAKPTHGRDAKEKQDEKSRTVANLALRQGNNELRGDRASIHGEPSQPGTGRGNRQRRRGNPMASGQAPSRPFAMRLTPQALGQPHG